MGERNDGKRDRSGRDREIGIGQRERERERARIQVWDKERDMELFYYLPCYLSLLKML